MVRMVGIATAVFLLVYGVLSIATGQDREDTRQFLDESRCSYFVKPFNLERVTAAVDMLTGPRSTDTIG